MGSRFTWIPAVMGAMVAVGITVLFVSQTGSAAEQAQHSFANPSTATPESIGFSAENTRVFNGTATPDPRTPTPNPFHPTATATPRPYTTPGPQVFRVSAPIILNAGITWPVLIATPAPISVNVKAPAPGSSCKSESRYETCGVLFAAESTSFATDGVPRANTAIVTYSGHLPVRMGLYIANYKSKSASLPECTANDPASMVQLQILEDGKKIYPVNSEYTSLSQFASEFSSPATALPLQSTTATGLWTKDTFAQITIQTVLNPAADNGYQGCRSAADFVWSAS